MYTSPLRIVSVRPELERMAEYVPGESLESFSLRSGIPINNLIKLNSNESPYGPAPSVLRALSDHTWYNNYPDTNSTLLKAALSQYTGLDECYIVVGHGSMEVISLLWHTFLSVGDNIICCPPTYSLYTSVSTLCGAYVLEVPRTPEYEIDVDAVLEAITPETKMIVLCSPNNPTGNPVAEADVLTLLDTGRIIVVDEAYIEFSDKPKGMAQMVTQYPNLVVLRTFSKWAGLAGLRVGYGLFPEWIVAYIRRAQCPFEVNVAGHIAAIETLRNLDFVLGNVARIIEERERLYCVMCRQSYLEPLRSQGNFIMAHVCEEEVQMKQVRAIVESHGILLRYFNHPYLQNFLRVTVGLPEHTDALEQALAEVVPA